MKVRGIPCCYYPTTVVLVDDDEKYLNILKDSIDSNCRTFSKPYEAIKFFATSKMISSLERICSSEERNQSDTNTISIDTTKLHHNLYNADRLNEVSVLVIDYQMPSLNGLELCQSLRNTELKIVMLTGEASVDLAINAFNNSIIDKFINKNSTNLHDELTKVIGELQFQHFQDISEYFIDSLAKSRNSVPSFLQNESFCIFFQDLLSKNNIIEYYLLNNAGDFIMINNFGKILYFFVRDILSIKETHIFTEAEYLQHPSKEAEKLFNSVKEMKIAPFLWGLKNMPNFTKWPFYQLQHEICDGDIFYYMLILNDQYPREIDHSKIASYCQKI